MEYSLKWVIPLAFLSGQLVGHGENPVAVAGDPTFEYPDSKTQVIHAPDKTAINFKKFNIAKDETVRFVQPHHRSSVLCRVTGGQPSLIEGILEANGRLLLVNPASIVFRETAQVRAGSLVASTLDIKDEDFIKGKSRFFLQSSSQDSVIINQGNISAEQVIFMAPQIVNSGVITARADHIAFLGGELITLDFEGDHLISFAIDVPLKTGFIEQGGQLSALQGDVHVKLRVASELIRSVVNVNGLIEASSIQKENGVVRLVGNIAAKNKITLEAEHKLHWQGGKFEAGGAEVAFRAADLVLDSPVIGPFKSLSFTAKTIDQNSLVNARMAPVVYEASQIYLGGDVSTSNKDITFKGDVLIDNQVKIIGGHSSGGKITFTGRLDADHPTRLLEIKNGKGTLDFQKEIGGRGPLGELKIIETGKLLMPNVGNKNQAGVQHLNIKNSSLYLHETATVHANQQTWNNVQIFLREGKTATFLSDSQPMTFAADCNLQMEPHAQVFFEGKKGGIELPVILGDHRQPITVNAGQGSVKTNQMLGKLGELRIQGREIILGGKIAEAGSIFMEADRDIHYSSKDAIVSEGDVILNAKHGMIGSDELPIHVTTQGRLYVGAKSMAYLDGNSADGYPHVYAKNPPPRLIFHGHEVQYLLIEEVFAEEEQLMSLMPDLFHVIPGGFIHSLMLTPRRAPIYYKSN